MLSITKQSGCRRRQWLCTGKNSTPVDTDLFDNTFIDKTVSICNVGIVGVFVIEIILVIASYIKNILVDSIYYFYPDCFKEIISMILFHYAAACIYLLCPLIIWCCMLGAADNSTDCNNISMPQYISGIPRKKQEKQPVEADRVGGRRQIDI